MTKWCAVPNCKTGSRTEQIKRSLFRIPKDPATWKKWEEAIPNIIKLRSTDVVCEKHFEENDISREWIKLDANEQVIARVTYKYPQLRKQAVPTKFDDVSSEIWTKRNYATRVPLPAPDIDADVRISFSPIEVLPIEVSPIEVSPIEVSSMEVSSCNPLITNNSLVPQEPFKVSSFLQINE
ncbi:hypothetical protein RF55_16552, partial [Lasius niger]